MEAYVISTLVILLIFIACAWIMAAFISPTWRERLLTVMITLGLAGLMLEFLVGFSLFILWLSML